MNNARLWLVCLVAFPAGPAAAARPDKVDEALAEVRHVKADLYRRHSSVLGRLPGPAEMAAHQLRCRPIPKPTRGAPREIRFDAETVTRAAALDPMALRKAPGRLPLTVLPLGITGAYVTEAKGRVELLVVHVLDDAPATGALRLDDIIIGANGRLFQDAEDPRPEMGHALVESQSPELGGILTLQIVRAAKPMNVKVDLGNTLSYSDTWPFDCAKSRRIRADAVTFVMSQYPWHRYDFWTPTFLMACGDEAAMELARRHLLKGLQDQYAEGTGSSTWRGGPRLMNLCEYYLLTGDSSVLPAIRHQAQGLAWAQYRSGSWTHGGGKGPSVLAPGTGGGGYGEVNCAGLGAFVGLCLARKCGVEPYGHTLPRSIRFFGTFCGSNLPYGLGSPGGERTGRMDNGMNSTAAMAFHLLGEEAMAVRWARSVCYMWMGRERGHAEGIFGAVWGPVGAALAPKEEFHAFMNHMRWAYEMGRARDGGLTFMRGSRWTYPNMTAAYGLFLCLPQRRLQILGGDSVFARRPPEGLAEAARLYKDKKWTQLRTVLNGVIKAGPRSPEHLAYAKDLLAAHDRLEKHAAATLKIIRKSIADGRRATAQTQLDLLARMLGEERPSAAALRKALGGGKLQDPRPERPKPLMDSKEIIKRLNLAKGKFGDGFAHSPGYIAETNRRGFDGMPPEKIAGFLAHFSGAPASGAARALASHGPKVLPLLKRLLKDTHHGIRSGALATLKHMYASDSKEFRTDVPAEQAEIIKLVRPLIEDESQLVRRTASDLVVSMKVLNDDIYAILFELARHKGSGVEKVNRYGIKDPQIRTKLSMRLIETANRFRDTVPARYKPMVVATTAHIELCEPYIQTAVETLNNPEVLMMYGFFSNHPPNGALQILEHYARNPQVLKSLPDVLRFAARKQSGVDSYWYPIVEYPHRIIVKIGPKALPIVEAFCASEQALHREIQFGRHRRPAWWKESTPEYVATWRRQMAETADLVRSLYQDKPSDKAIQSMCALYLSGRAFGAWERQRIRDRITELGLEVLPAVRPAVATQEPAVQAELGKEIAAKQAEADALTDRRKKGAIKKEIKVIESRKAALEQRAGELSELVSLVEVFHKGRPSSADVQALCRFYVKRPWGNRYPFDQHNTSYMRPLHGRQLGLVRDTLQRWGKAALPALRAFVEEDKHTLASALAALDKEEEFWKPQWARKAMLPLSRIALEREDIRQISAELADLAALIGCASCDRLSAEQLGALCRIITRRGWPAQKALAGDLLKRAGARAVKVIGTHILGEKKALSDTVARIRLLMSDSVKRRVTWRYDRARAAEATLRQGIKELEGLAGTLR